MKYVLLTMATSAILFGMPNASAQSNVTATNGDDAMQTRHSQSLSARQKAIVPIAAFAAAGDIEKLNTALQRGLDAGLSISDCREILVQLYAYAGFPRSLNALAELIKVLDERKQRGIKDIEGKAPGPLPSGNDSLAVGTQNQSKLIGAPAKGALFEFSPAIDQYLKAHLFGDIFARDNLDWKSRELATVGALAAMSGVEVQLQSHLKISMNVGLTRHQLNQLPQVLETQGDPQASARMQSALTSMSP